MLVGAPVHNLSVGDGLSFEDALSEALMAYVAKHEHLLRELVVDSLVLRMRRVGSIIADWLNSRLDVDVAVQPGQDLVKWPLFPAQWSWVELFIAVATIGSAIFAGVAFEVNRRDRVQRDRPKLMLTYGPVVIGTPSPPVGGIVLNEGDGPALNVRVNFGDVKIVYARNGKKSINVKPRPVDLFAVMGQSRSAVSIFPRHLWAEIAKAIEVKEGEGSGRRPYAVDVIAQPVVTFRDKGGRKDSVKMPFQLTGSLVVEVSQGAAVSGVFSGQVRYPEDP